jgi:hypothetical protein
MVSLDLISHHFRIEARIRGRRRAAAVDPAAGSDASSRRVPGGTLFGRRRAAARRRTDLNVETAQPRQPRRSN